MSTAAKHVGGFSVPSLKARTIGAQLLHFALASAIVEAAFLLRYAFRLGFGIDFPHYITFYPAVMIAALLFGPEFGLLTTVLSALLVDYWIFQPKGRFAIVNHTQGVSLLLFVSIGIFLSVVVGRYRRYQSRIAILETNAVVLESEERFRALITATSDVSYRMSSDWTEMRHLDGRNFIVDTHSPSSTWLDLYIPPNDQALVKTAIAEAIQAGDKFELERRVLACRRKAGVDILACYPAEGRKRKCRGMAWSSQRYCRTENGGRAAAAGFSRRTCLRSCSLDGCGPVLRPRSRSAAGCRWSDHWCHLCHGRYYRAQT